MSRSRNRSPRFLDRLEDRALMTGLNLQPDYFNMMLPGNAASFPPAVVDVLANDDPQTLRILSFSQPALGTVEKITAGANPHDMLQYNAGPNFRGYDFFTYTAVNESGEEASASVYVKFDYTPGTFSPWSIQAPDTQTVSPGTSTRLLGDDGKPIAIIYEGQEIAKAGVLLQFSPYLPLAAFGTLNSTETRADATFYPQQYGSAWLYGTLDGVNALLSSLEYTPTDSLTTIPDVSISLHAFIYGALGISSENQTKSIKIIPSGSPADPEPGSTSPLAVNDEFIFDSITDSIALDVLANDSSRTPSGKLELIDVQTTGNPQGLAWIDAASNRIIYQPLGDFVGSDLYKYTVRNENGLVSQAFFKITVAPKMTFISTSGDQQSKIIEVYNALTGEMVNTFKPFGDYSGGMIIQSGDANGDGMTDVFAMQTSVEGRMRVFDASGQALVDTVYKPFGNRRINSMDMEIGDMDSDKSAEMIFVANTSRGYELKLVDSATMQTQMTTLMRGMSGEPQLEFDETTRQLMIMGRSRGGGVVMARMSASNAGGQPSISRKTMMSDRDIRRLTRSNGPLTDITLVSMDQNSDGVLDQRMIQMAFRNGVVQQMLLSGDGVVKSSREQSSITIEPQTIMAALGLAMTPSGDLVWNDSVDPSRRNRNRIIALG